MVDSLQVNGHSVVSGNEGSGGPASEGRDGPWTSLLGRRQLPLMGRWMVFLAPRAERGPVNSSWSCFGIVFLEPCLWKAVSLFSWLIPNHERWHRNIRSRWQSWAPWPREADTQPRRRKPFFKTVPLGFGNCKSSPRRKGAPRFPSWTPRSYSV